MICPRSLHGSRCRLCGQELLTQSFFRALPLQFNAGQFAENLIVFAAAQILTLRHW